MAITENTFEATELMAAMDANPALEAAIRTGLGSKKFVVHNETEHQSFINNFKDNDYRNRVISEHTSEFAPKLEKDIKDLTGIDKVNADEKYYDYLKRAFGEKLKPIKEMEAELERLKKGGNPSEADRLRIQQLEAGIEEKEQTWSKKYNDKVAEFEGVRIGGILDKAFSVVRPAYKAGLPESMVKRAEQAVAAELQDRIRIQEDGTETVVDAEGKVILDKTTYKPKAVSAIIAEELGDMIDTGKQQQGSGTKNDNVDPGKGGAAFDGVVPADIKTRLALTEFLNKKGLTSDSPEFAKIFAEKGKDLPLREN